jgi:hypothetical protein
MPEWIQQMAWGAAFIFGSLFFWTAWHEWKDDDDEQHFDQ